MAIQLKPIEEQVIVIAGASSGIGLVTAKHAARAGARVVLAARNESSLRSAVAAIRRHGGRATYVVADVADPQQVARIADATLGEFGRIDTWVNNAGIATYGTVEAATIDEMRRAIEVDLLGAIYGSKTGLPHLRQSRGTLINVSSVAGRLPVPLLAAYSAAKHGVVGFSDALRMELDHDKTGVSVTTILPYGINTPFFNHARSRLAAMPRPTPPADPTPS